MTPFQFGRPGQALYGVYHAPRASVARKAAVVLCAPVAHEYMRTHIALRALAGQLARSGLHVLRFDYLGTGDSAGEPAELRLEFWLQDIGLAERELREISGAEQMSLVGLRLGATLAGAALARGIATADQLVLWDPVVEGRSYLAGIEALHRQFAALRATPPTETTEIFGFPFPPALRRGIEELDLAELADNVRAQRLTLAVSTQCAEYVQLRERLARAGREVDYRHVQDAGDWDSLDMAFNAVLAGRIQQAVAGGIAGSA